MKIKLLLSISFVFVFVSSCSKETLPNNPFDQNQNDTTLVDTTTYDPYSIFSIHKDVLKPSCANSGCHDGNFEPDFRTVESSYFGLINVKPIKSDFSGNFPARVVPGNSAKSMLLQRMTVDLNGNSGIMPLALDPNSTYNVHKESYLKRITKWIDNGAPDLAGNLPTIKNFPPQIQGVAFIQGNSVLTRPGKYEAANALVNQNTTVYFSILDDQADQSQLTCTVNWSTDPDTFDATKEVSMNAGPEKIMNGLDGKSHKFWFNIDVSTNSMLPLDVLWFRITIIENGQKILIPNENSMFPLKKYFALRFN